MKTDEEAEKKFYSMAEIEKRYFPKSSKIEKEKIEEDPESLGVIIARSSLNKVKTLFGAKQDLD